MSVILPPEAWRCRANGPGLRLSTVVPAVKGVGTGCTPPEGPFTRAVRGARLAASRRSRSGRSGDVSTRSTAALHTRLVPTATHHRHGLLAIRQHNSHPRPIRSREADQLQILLHDLDYPPQANQLVCRNGSVELVLRAVAPAARCAASAAARWTMVG